MTNREWIQKQTDMEFAKAISENLVGEYPIDIVRWLNKEHYENKELSFAQLYQAFDFKFAGRRAISLEECRKVLEDIFK